MSQTHFGFQHLKEDKSIGLQVGLTMLGKVNLGKTQLILQLG
jgi:hypothetical protein